MKKFSILLLFVLIIFILWIEYSQSHIGTKPSDSLVTPTQRMQQVISPTGAITYCLPQNLESTIELSPAAGNVYGKLLLKNISRKSCKISGGQFVDALYDTNTVKNITIMHVGQTQSEPFVLSPYQTIYSQVHYPNGPQCQSIGIVATDVTFTYKVSPTGTVAFKDQTGGALHQVQTCKSPSDMTEIQIWKMSLTPITP